ncbi:MAG TPA: hypothetical protein VFA65_23245 [Bryobacteraceae bacterium]|nr:hypothetical protein [Bryobacteraceae bacterium]
MHSFSRTLLFTVTMGVFGATGLPAQRGAPISAGTPLPSSTAIGAGALSAFPSSTSRSSAPAIARPGFGVVRPGYSVTTRPGYAASPIYSHPNNNRARREYRPLPWSYVVAPYYYPAFDLSGGTDYSAAPPYDDPGYDNGPDAATDAMMRNQAAIGQQVQKLTSQVNDLMYGQGYPPPPAAPQQEAQPSIPVTLVLRSGEQLQVQNYAVTGDSFWAFAQHGTRKIPLASIDLPASAKATQANGGDFPQIGTAK